MIWKVIAPDIWDREADADGNLAYLTGYNDILHRFMARTAEEKMGIVIDLS